MAENGTEQNLDLEQILQTLANLPKTASVPQEDQQEPYAPNRLLEQPSNVPASYHPPQYEAPYRPEQPLNLRSSSGPSASARQHPVPQNRTTTPLIDPATITEWKHGLRCVNKIATHNPNFVSTVQKLMKDQERNVKEWEAGRQRLIEDQDVKRENEKTHRAALSLPGILDNTAPLRTPEREQEELTQYDQKVYRACRQMVDLQAAQLKSLGVPFFGINPELMRPDDVELVEDMEPQEGGDADKKVTKKQLLELQRKMLNHLTELYGE